QEAQDGSARRCYSSHPVIAQFFYTSIAQDALLMHDGVARYRQRELEAHNYRIPAGGGASGRTRGITTRGPPRPGPLPSDPVVLDLLEEVVYHSARGGNFTEALAIYRDNLGGFYHLGRTLHDFSRGQRIVSWFLDAKAPPQIREEGRTEVDLYQSAQ